MTDSTNDTETKIAELEQRVISVRKYLESTTKSYKKVRQMRGADAHRKAWELEAQLKRYNETIDSLNEQLLQLRRTAYRSLD